MAKVTGPLFSLTARGKLANSLVYMNWKGIDDVRQYVVPANPRTAGQQTQRGYFTAGVTDWHTAGYTADDVAAYDLAALAEKLPMSGFNIHEKYYVDAVVAGLTWYPLTAVAISSITASGASVAANVASDETGVLYYGTSKSTMNTSVSGTFTTDHYDFTLSGLSASTKYYFYIKNTAASAAGQTGIYTFTTLAS